MPNLMEKHLKEYGHHFERSLNPKLYDELYGDYVPDESPRERIEDVIPFNPETVSDASYVRPSEVRMYSEKTPVLEPLDKSHVSLEVDPPILLTTSAPPNSVTATSRETLSQNHPAKLLPDS